MSRAPSIQTLLLCLALPGCAEVGPRPEPSDSVGAACVVPGADLVTYEFGSTYADAQCPWDRGCGVTEYVGIPALFPDDFHETLDDEQLDERLWELVNGYVHVENARSDGPSLREDLLAATRADVLFDGIEERPLQVQLLEESTDFSWRGEFRGDEQMRARDVLVTDPVVGRLQMVFYLPLQGAGPFPPVVIAHGHADSPWSAGARRNLAEELTKSGFAAVAPGFRANEGDFPETAATRGLLKQGYTLMMVRNYEQILARRVLAVLPEVDPCAPVGLIGHSGGSVAGNITVRIAPEGLGFASYVSDLTSTYLNWNSTQGVTLDETGLDLFALSESINRFDTAGLPVLEVPYDYEDGVLGIVEFFDATLRQ